MNQLLAASATDMRVFFFAQHWQVLVEFIIVDVSGFSAAALIHRCVAAAQSEERPGW